MKPPNDPGQRSIASWPDDASGIRAPTHRRRLGRAVARAIAITLLMLPFAACSGSKNASAAERRRTSELRAPSPLLWDAGRWDFDRWQ